MILELCCDSHGELDTPGYPYKCVKKPIRFCDFLMKELHIWGVPRREAVNEGVEYECLGSPKKRGSQRCKAA